MPINLIDELKIFKTILNSILNLQQSYILIWFAAHISTGHIFDDTVPELQRFNRILSGRDLEGVAFWQQPFVRSQRVTSVVKTEHFRREQFVRVFREVQSQSVSIRIILGIGLRVLLEFDFYWLDVGLYLEVEFVIFVYYVFYCSHEFLYIRGSKNYIKSC